jgi:hypothetical protein
VNVRLENRNELDTIVVNIELTLSSIVQGVALSFLADGARGVFALDRAQAWPYVAAGLVIVLLFWSRSLIHTLTLSRWPLEFGHNCLYIACALVEVIAFTRVNDPFGWFIMLAVFAASVWIVFIYDLKMIRMRFVDSAGTSGARLYALVLRDQRMNIGIIVPLVFVFNLGAALAIRSRPDFFIGRDGHLIFILLETVGLLVYLVTVIRSFVKLTPLIAETREEWRTKERRDEEEEAG